MGPGNGNTLAEIRDRDNEQRLNAAAAAIDADPFVRDLIENFGARVSAVHHQTRAMRRRS